MARIIPSILIFAIGAALGGLIGPPIRSLLAPSPKSEDKNCIPKPVGWETLIDEAVFQDRIVQFQRDLDDKTGNPDEVDKLTKSLQAQLNIEDLIMKSREARYNKFGSLYGFVGPILGAFIGALLPYLLAPLFSKARKGRVEASPSRP